MSLRWSRWQTAPPPSAKSSIYKKPSKSHTEALSQVSTAADKSFGIDEDRLGLNILFSSPEPLVDFIFVHGLGGGSKKTWSKTASIDHFWPQEWLSLEDLFHNVRVSSFGYDSAWAKRADTCLDIEDFAKSLIGGMNISPELGTACTPVVFVGHSMGGLVIKKAYSLARQDKSLQTLAERFHTICFLATPHRGSNSAQLLHRLLHFTLGSRSYVTDLRPFSKAVQSINDEFRQYASELRIKSFYETRKMQIGFGLSTTLIVDKNSATLGYPQEDQMPMNADHRSICKFESPTDPNYVILRDSFVSIIQEITGREIPSSVNTKHDRVKQLKAYLGVNEKPEDDLTGVEDAKLPGTCEWISTKRYYTNWKNHSSDAPKVLWLKAKPATGKSVLAGHIIGDLAQTDASQSYFFFKYGDRSKSKLSSCLRSLALQMALRDSRIMEALLQMCADDINIDQDNERTLWRKLFIATIFAIEIAPQYWILDALDECTNFADCLAPLLARIEPSIPVRILITSRDSVQQVENEFVHLGVDRYRSALISAADTFEDLRLLLASRASSLLVRDEHNRVELVKEVLDKSKGSFLWTVLVLNELSTAHGEEEVDRILDEVPRDMVPLYHRALEIISLAARGKELAKAVLSWATCTTRPMTSDELDGALKLDIGDSVANLPDSLETLCGQLVHVDQFGKVQMVHGTAREFLLSDNLVSEFAVEPLQTHTRIARSCLKYLVSDDMRPPRSRRKSHPGPKPIKRSPFAAYACEAFSYHLARSDPCCNDVLDMLYRFLKQNVLSWIESIARTRNLTPLIRTAKNLKKYLNACSAIHSPLGRAVSTIRSWTTDFIRIAAKFSDVLIQSPASIFWLVPPFCPTDSAVYEISIPGRKLTVQGISNTNWDDRLSCIDFKDGQTSAVACGSEFFAVGLNSGMIALYTRTTCQEYRFFNHREAVVFLQFSPRKSLFASCGQHTIRVWDISSGEQLHCFEVAQKILCLAFAEDVLTVAFSAHYISSWNIHDGTLLPDRPWFDSHELSSTQRRYPPCAISISLEHQMMAIAYRGRPITLWDLREDCYYGNCGKKLPNGATGPYWVISLVFNPNQAIDLLAATYQDGDLVLIDPFNDKTMVRFRADCHKLAASPNGRLLVSADAFGTIQVYEFDTLRVLYRIKTSAGNIRQLGFSHDGLQFLDVRGSQCNIWEPPILLRDHIVDDSSDGSFPLMETTAAKTPPKVTAIVLHPFEDVAICGNDDGSITFYDLESGEKIQDWFQNKAHCAIRTLVLWQNQCVLISVDVSNAISAWKLQSLNTRSQINDSVLFYARLNCGRSVAQLCVGRDTERFILSTRESDHLWDINGKEEDSYTYPVTSPAHRWIQHPSSDEHLIRIDNTAAHIYTWRGWKAIAVISLDITTTNLQVHSVWPCSQDQKILIEMVEQYGSLSTRSLHLFDPVPSGSDVPLLSDPTGDTISGAELSILGTGFTTLLPYVSHVIGIYEERKIIFLNNQSWVCSADLPTDVPVLSYQRHFFVPYDWFSGARNVVCAVTRKDKVWTHSDAVFARNESIAVVKGGFEYAEEVRV